MGAVHKWRNAGGERRVQTFGMMCDEGGGLEKCDVTRKTILVFLAVDKIVKNSEKIWICTWRGEELIFDLHPPPRAWGGPLRRGKWGEFSVLWRHIGSRSYVVWRWRGGVQKVPEKRDVIYGRPHGKKYVVNKIESQKLKQQNLKHANIFF